MSQIPTNGMGAPQAQVPCPYCHAMNAAGAKFCAQCGRPLQTSGPGMAGFGTAQPGGGAGTIPPGPVPPPAGGYASGFGAGARGRRSSGAGPLGSSRRISVGADPASVFDRLVADIGLLEAELLDQSRPDYLEFKIDLATWRSLWMKSTYRCNVTVEPEAGGSRVTASADFALGDNMMIVLVCVVLMFFGIGFLLVILLAVFSIKTDTQEVVGDVTAGLRRDLPGQAFAGR